MRRISPQTEERIIALWFKGLPRDTIARRTAVSGSTVSLVVGKLPEFLREYRQLSVEFRKLILSPSEAMKGAKLHSKLAELNVDPDQLQGFIKAVAKLSKKAEYHPREVVQAVMKLSNLEETSGKSYPEAIRDFQIKTKQIRELNERELKVRGRIEETEKELKRRLRQNRITIREIEYVNGLRQGLRRFHIKLTEVEDLRKLVENMREMGIKPKRFVEFTRRHGSLKGRLTYLENKKHQKIIELRGIQKETEIGRSEKGRLESKVLELRRRESEAVVRSRELEKEEAQYKDSLEALSKCVAQMLEVKVDVIEMNNAIKALAQRQQNLEDGIKATEKAQARKELEIQKLDMKKLDLEREVESILEIRNYATEHGAAIKSLGQQEASLDKKLAEKKGKIALVDTITNFLTRQSSYDFDRFCSMVETVKRIRDDKTSPLRHLVPRIEERIRVEALKAFEGDLVDKIFHQKVWDQKEKYRKENIQLNEENTLLKDQLTSVSKEKEILQQIKVHVEEKPRTLKELKAMMISICEEETERRVKERFDRQAAAASGIVDFALRTIKKKTGSS